MEKAADVVKDALQEIGVHGSEQQLPASELNDGIRYLNRMLAAWDARGIKLGYSVALGPNDEMTVPAGAIEGIVFNLAYRLASVYDMPVNADLADKANNGMVTIRKLGIKMCQQRFSGNLPIGSGNDNSSVYDNVFFAGKCEDGDFSGTSYDPDTNGDC